MTTLHEYFKRAAERPQAFTEAELRALIDTAKSDTQRSVGPRTEHGPNSTNNRGRTMTILAFAALATGIGVMMLNVHFDSSPPNHSNRQSVTQASSHKASVAVAPLGKSTPTAGLQRAASLPAAVPGALPATVPAKASPPVKPSHAARANREEKPKPVEPFAVHPIELRAAELAKLGLRADTDGVWMAWQEAGQSEPFIWAVTSRGMILPPEGTRLKGVDISRVMPVMITDEYGQKRNFIYDDDMLDSTIAAELRAETAVHNTSSAPDTAAASAERARQLAIESTQRTTDRKMQAGGLVPIIVRTGHAYTTADSIAGRWHPDCIVWYEPRPELLEILPERIRRQLNAEMLAAAQVTGNKVDGWHAADQQMAERKAVEGTSADKPTAENRVNGGEQSSIAPANTGHAAEVGEHPYLDILRSASGAVLSSELVPNPAREQAVLSYRLAEPRRVAVALYDVSGRRLREIAPEEQKPQGITGTTVPTATLTDGIYLIAITTDRGERVVQRLIVRH